MFYLIFCICEPCFGQHITEAHAEILIKNAACLARRKVQLPRNVLKLEIRVVEVTDYFVNVQLPVMPEIQRDIVLADYDIVEKQAQIFCQHTASVVLIKMADLPLQLFCKREFLFLYRIIAFLRYAADSGAVHLKNDSLSLRNDLSEGVKNAGIDYDSGVFADREDAAVYIELVFSADYIVAFGVNVAVKIDRRNLERKESVLQVNINRGS